MLQGKRCPRSYEAEHADDEGHQVSHKDTTRRRHRRYPPEGKERARLASTLIERHEQAEHDPRQRQEEQQSPDK